MTDNPIHEQFIELCDMLMMRIQIVPDQYSGDLLFDGGYTGKFIFRERDAGTAFFPWKHNDIVGWVPEESVGDLAQWYVVNDNKTPTEAHKIALKQVMQDFERAKCFVLGYWGFVGIIVTLELDGKEIAYDDIWGVESDAEEHQFALSKEMADSIIDELPEIIQRETEKSRDKIRMLESVNIEKIRKEDICLKKMA